MLKKGLHMKLYCFLTIEYDVRKNTVSRLSAGIRKTLEKIKNYGAKQVISQS